MFWFIEVVMEYNLKFHTFDKVKFRQFLFFMDFLFFRLILHSELSKMCQQSEREAKTFETILPLKHSTPASSECPQL